MTPKSMPNFSKMWYPKIKRPVISQTAINHFLIYFKIPNNAITDLIVATLALKYTQSNSVAYAYRGSIIGLGAGQQSRIHCTRLAGSKADLWWLRHHPRVLALPFKKGVKRAEKANAIDLFVGGEELEGGERTQWESLFEVIPTPLSEKERAEHMRSLDG